MILALACAPPEEPLAADARIVLQDGQNFAYSASLQAPVLPLGAGEDATLTWGALQTDMLGIALDPATEVTDVFVVVFGGMTPDEVAAALAVSAVPSEAVVLYLSYAPSEPSCRLTDLTLLGSDPGVLEWFEPGNGTWTFVLATLPEGETVRYRSVAFLDPVEGAGNEGVLEEGATRLDADVSLGSALEVPSGGAWSLDWSTVTLDGLGNVQPVYKIDRLDIGFYEGMGAAEVEADFTLLETLVTRQWSVDVSGRTDVAVAEAVDDAGEAFPGVEGDGTWLLALSCGTCSTPMPRFLVPIVAR